jgi:hypothetical protein
MLSDKKKASTRIAEILSYSSHFKQTVGAESRRFATGKQRQKQKHLPRTNTEKHGNKKKNNHGRLNKRGQVSFSALNIFCSWFRLTAEKET